MKHHHGFGHIYLEPKPTSEFSWWIDAPQDHFFDRARQEEPRMRGSKAYQFLGDPPLVGKIEPRKEKQ